MAKQGYFIEVEATGPLFTLGGDPVRDASRDSVRDLVAFAERTVKLDLYPGHGVITGHYRRSIHGEITKSMHGPISETWWGIVHDSLVIYGPWLEGVSQANQKSRFKGYRMFRKAREKTNRRAGLIADRRLSLAVRVLNGH